MKRILVIGNGFDLAHELLTSYFDFLYACCLITGDTFEGREYIDGVLSPYNKEKFTISNLVKQRLKPLEEKIKSNKWIKYFLVNIHRLKPTWVDLEREIQEACKYISENHIPVDNKYEPLVTNGKLDAVKLKDDLADLKEILDLYLSIATSTGKKIYYKELLEYLPDYVVSFNYTNTYTKIYNYTSNVDYVHGELKKDNSPSTIVLGFNSTDSVDSDIFYAEYLKYFQMVKNKITVEIFNAIKSFKGDNYELMFFGHSLDKSDSDILLPLIEKAKKVTIVYYSDSAMSTNIKNLMETINNREIFISFCLKDENKIRFIHQTKGIKAAAKFDGISNLYELINKKIDKDTDLDKYLDFCESDSYNICNEIYIKFLNKIYEYIENNKTIYRHQYLFRFSKIRDIMHKKGILELDMDYTVYNFFNTATLTKSK